jgi:Tol biopolymer transport system component
MIQINLTTGTITESFVPPVRTMWSIASSADGGRIAFAGNRGDPGPWDIVTSDLYLSDSRFENLTVLVRSVTALSGTAWSADGKSLIFTGSRDGKYGLWLLDVDSKRVSLVEPGFFRTSASAWSPDGTRVVAVQHLDRKEGEARRGNRLLIITVKR